MRKALIVSMIGVCALSARADVRIWDGGGADDNLMTDANWEGDVAPVSGDTLVFKGSVRTQPYNDFDPNTTIFKGIVFANSSSSGCISAFTLKGNRIRLQDGPANVYDGVTQGFGIWPSTSGSSIWDTIEADVDLTTNSKLGCYSAGGHHLIFTGTVTGNGGALRSMDQYYGTLTFRGPVKNFTHAERPNGSGGAIDLLSDANEFIDDSSHSISEGTLRVSGADALDGTRSKSVFFGQPAWDTPGYLVVDSATDVVLSNNITVRGPIFSHQGGTIQNAKAGTTLTYTGTITAQTQYTDSSYYTGFSTGLGTGLGLSGDGDGVFAGTLSTPGTWLVKGGKGTWTLSEESSCVSTGDVRVAAGKLVINGDYSTMKSVSVESTATLAGTGRVNSVTFGNGSTCLLHVDADGIRGLDIATELLVNGDVTLSLDGDSPFEAGCEYVLFTFPSSSGTGSFSPGAGLPPGSTLARKADRVTLTVASAGLIWRGNAGNNVWDFSSANWSDNMLYSDGASVTFGEVDSALGNVVVSAPVAPTQVTVRGCTNYCFSGAGITGTASVLKSVGSGMLTFANDNTYTGETRIKSGAFVLEGSLTGTDVLIEGSGVFTNAATGRIAGPGSVSISGPASELYGTNTFTGDLSYKVNFVEDEKAIMHRIRSMSALGAGDVVVHSGAIQFRGVKGATGAGRTLDLGATSKTLVYATSDSDVTWEGNVSFRNQLNLRVDGTLTFGAADGSSVVNGATGNIYVRQNGVLHWRAPLNLVNFEQTDRNVNHFWARGSVWTKMNVAAGGIVCEGTNVLAVAPLALGQVYQTYTFAPYLDLKGFDQTISELIMNDSIEGSVQTVKSTNPATLTIKNDADTTTLRKQGRIDGAVSLRKQGAGNWSFGCRNNSTGNVVVEEGTFTVTADDALPTASPDSTLFVKRGAQVVLADGVNARVSRLSTGEIELPAGVYGGTGCAVAGAKIRPALFGEGTGSLTVLKGSGSLTLIIR